MNRRPSATGDSSGISLPVLLRNLQPVVAAMEACSRPLWIETHISWIVLCGNIAYKFKKPVDLGFLDYSSLELRHQYCDLELTLNRRFAPQLYLEVVPVTGSVDQPQLGGAGPVLEYALKMRRMPEDSVLGERPAFGNLEPELFENLAHRLNLIHSDSPPHREATVLQVWEPVVATLDLVRRLGTSAQRRMARTLSVAMERDYTTRTPHFQERIDRGEIRECHGDLHLGNIALLDGVLTPFDCIEFSAELRQIDRISDIAFLFMDLLYRGQAAWGWRFINAYFEASGDYHGASLLWFYTAYRALVRAKIALLTPASNDSRQPTLPVDHYLDIAETAVRAEPRCLILMHGVSGSGKSWLASRLAQRLGAVVVRSDRERRRLEKRTRLQDPYGAEANRQTYLALLSAAQHLMVGRQTAIVDATFLRPEEIEPFRDLAERCHLALRVVHCMAPDSILRQRIEQRQQSGDDPSEATVAVMQEQQREFRPLSPDLHAVTVDTTGPDPVAEVLNALAVPGH